MTDPRHPTVLPEGGANSVAMMLGLLGDEWTLLIAQQSLLGITRYAAFAKALPISNAVLTSRFRMLTEQGLLERRPYLTKPPRFEYQPTARMRSLWKLMLVIWDWERTWVTGQADELPDMRHRTCGEFFTPAVICARCGQPGLARDVVAEWGPSGSWERSVPHAVTRRRWDSRTSTSPVGMFPETMAIFGNRWSSALLGAIFRGLTRFSEFESALGAPPTVISDRLRVFTAMGILRSSDEPTRRDGPGYHLTDKGRAFFPVIEASLEWAHRWFVSPEGPAVVQTHRQCGGPFSLALACDRCGGRLAGATVEAVGATTHESTGPISPHHRPPGSTKSGKDRL